MPDLSLEQIARMAENLGHFDLAVVPMGSGTWWKATCSCGYNSSRRRTAALAAEAAGHHMLTVARKYVASGRSVPQLTPPTDRVPADTPNEHSAVGMYPPAARV